MDGSVEDVIWWWRTRHDGPNDCLHALEGHPYHQSTVLFGTGLGTAFFKWAVDRSRNFSAIRIVSERVVLADWLFRTPAILVQPLTGIMLANRMGYSLERGWLFYSICLYCFAGICWIPVVGLQIRMRDLARASHRDGVQLDAAYWRLARRWFWLGLPAFASVVIIFWLMVRKPGL